jgi:murein DD-endopeptidase MepM/ murein hydrolase activator NlpD
MPDKLRPKGLLIVGIALTILLGSGSYLVVRAFLGYPLFWENNIGGGNEEDLLYLLDNMDYLASDTSDFVADTARISYTPPAASAAERIEDAVPEVSQAAEEEEPVQTPLSAWDLVKVHVVEKGESLWSIARKYDIDVDTIIGSNELKSYDTINIGQKLTILPFKGVTHKVEKGDSLWSIAQRYGASVDEIIETNELVSQNIQVGQTLLIPGGKLSEAEKERRLLIARGGIPEFIRPVSGGWISSRFGMRWGKMHQGVDLAVSTGTPVKAAASGTVTQAGNAGSYGLLVIIKHANGYETRYAHNSRITVKVGQYVKQGDIIAYSGNTGNSTGPHLHFEIRVNGKAVDPLNFIK